MTVESGNKNTVRAFVDAVNRRDWRALSALVAPGFRRYGAAAGARAVDSREALVDFLKQECVAFPDGREAIADLVAEGDRVAARQHFTGTQTGPMGCHPPSGKELSAPYLVIYRLEKGVIHEAWAEWDNLSALVQLGHVAPFDARGNGPGARRTGSA